MTVKITIDLNRKFTVNTDINKIFSLLADVPSSVAHFPKVQALTPLADNSFRWEMEEINSGGHSIQTIYACKYTADNNAKTIVWIPVKGVGNGLVSGKWELTEVATGTHISFTTKAELTLPFPRLLKLVVSPIVKLEFTGLVETYLRNLKGLWT